MAPYSAVICTKYGKYSGTLYYVPETGEVWICKKCLPIVFARGEEVEVSDDGKDRWKWIYYDTIVWIPEDEQPYIVKRHMHVCYNTRKYIRKLPKQEAWPKVFYIEKDVDDFVKGYSVPQRSIIQAAAIKDFLKSKNLLDFDEE